MIRLAMLFIAVALVLPGAALARPAADRDTGTRPALSAQLDEHGVDQAAANRKAAAIGRYYASYADSQSLPAPKPAPVVTEPDGISSSLAIGVGIGLILVAGSLGVVAGRTVRPRHLGA